ESYPTCNCACCSFQHENRGKDAGAACLPIYYGQEFLHEGFADCQRVVGGHGMFCDSHPDDPSAAWGRSSQVDTAWFCIHRCMPSDLRADTDPSDSSSECVPATARALRAAGVDLGGG
ncbi:unnamed protein product, partial [Prorocentrum cordatum]